MPRKYCGEVLPYLEIKKQENNQDIAETVEMPNVIGMTVKEANKILKDLGLEINIANKIEESKENDTEKIIVEQLPKKGIQISTNATVILYTE